MSRENSSPRRGRRPARTPEQLRNDMLDAGMALLAERGLTVGFETVRFEDAVLEASAPRASAYRAWSDQTRTEGPQVLFHDALAARLLREQPGGYAHDHGLGRVDDGAVVATLAAVGQLADQMPASDSMSGTDRGWWLRQIARAGANANVEFMDDSRLWHSYIAVAAGLMSQRELPPELEEAWREGEAKLAARYTDLYRSMAELFGLRLRYCYTWEQFDTAAAAIAEGLIIRAPVSPHVGGIRRATGPEGEEQTWSLFAVCFEALIRQFLEPDGSAVDITSLEHEASSGTGSSGGRAVPG